MAERIPLPDNKGTYIVAQRTITGKAPGGGFTYANVPNGRQARFEVGNLDNITLLNDPVYTSNGDTTAMLVLTGELTDNVPANSKLTKIIFKGGTNKAITNQRTLFLSGSNTGTVNGPAVFINDSLNAGTVNGRATFKYNSTNSGTLSTITAPGQAGFVFREGSANSGTLIGNATFYSSTNTGRLSSDGLFSNSTNLGTVKGTARFINGGQNVDSMTGQNGTVLGDAYFSSTQFNFASPFGVIGGTLSFGGSANGVDVAITVDGQTLIHKNGTVLDASTQGLQREASATTWLYQNGSDITQYTGDGTRNLKWGYNNHWYEDQETATLVKNDDIALQWLRLNTGTAKYTGSGTYLNRWATDNTWFSGTGNGTVGENGKVYRDGVLFTGTGNGFVGVSNTAYNNGVINFFTGIGNGNNGTENSKIYNSGVLFTGIGNGTVGEANKVYNAGILFTGIGNGTAGLLGRLYNTGTLFTGTGNGTVGEVGKLYSQGVLFSGTNSTESGSYVYSEGVLFTGIGDGIIGSDGYVYSNGMGFTGTGNGARGEDGKVYYLGAPYTGVGMPGLGSTSKLYSNGVLFNGVGNGTFGTADKVYIQGVASTYTGTQSSNASAPWIPGAYYQQGTLWTGAAFNGTVYVQGLVFTGTTAGLYYQDGVVLSGTRRDNGQFYYGGVPFNGAWNSLSGITYYINGWPFTGTSDLNGRAYLAGAAYTGMGDPTLVPGTISDKIYCNGILLTGVNNSSNMGNVVVGIQDRFYKQGSLGPGYDSTTFMAYGADGTLFTGTSDGTSGPVGWIFNNGVGKNGLLDGLMRYRGGLLTGIASGGGQNDFFRSVSHAGNTPGGDWIYNSFGYYKNGLPDYATIFLIYPNTGGGYKYDVGPNGIIKAY